MPFTVVCAPNAFKGALTAVEAAAAMARGVAAVPGTTALPVPVADGGDGTLDVLLDAAGQATHTEMAWVCGPLGERVDARLGWLDDITAVVELAEAAGLRLVRGNLDPMRATSRGVGELIAAALAGGATRILVGLGGSACTDGGAGIATALGARLLDEEGRALADGGGALRRLATVDLSGLHPGLRSCRIDVAADVSSPLLGPAGAAARFGPQKGAGADVVRDLEAGLERLARALESQHGVDHALRDIPGAGAAGGCGYGLAAFCGAELVPGARLVCDAVGLDRALAGAGLVLTGEGRLDASTAGGKAPVEVAARAAHHGVQCVALVGSVTHPLPVGLPEAVIIGPGLTEEESMRETGALLEAAAAATVRSRLSRPR